MVPAMNSGLKPGMWLLRLIDTLAELGIETSWLFQDGEGTQVELSHFEEEFYAILFELRAADPSLFEPDCNILDDYQLARSLRRGATTRATEAGGSQPDIDWMNGWNMEGSEIINGPMHVMYVERKLLLATHLRFSRAL